MPKKRPQPRRVAHETALQLRAFVCAFQRRTRAEFPETALPYPQQSLLRRLELDGPATTADLARSELITPQATGALVAELETAGYVVRRDDPDDGRRRVVALTTDGRTVLTERCSVIQSWCTRTIEDRLDEAEQRSLASAITLLNRILES